MSPKTTKIPIIKNTKIVPIIESKSPTRLIKTTGLASHRKKVLYFALDKRDTTAFWRCAPLAYLGCSDFELRDISDTKIFDWTTFLGCSVFIMQRPFGLEHSQVLQSAKNMGCRVILDYDDMLIDAVDLYNPTYRLYSDNQNNLKACLNLADEVWVSTEAIRQSYLPFNPNIYVIPNAHNDYLFRRGAKLPFDPHGRACYYRGGASHQADVNSMADTLLTVVKENPDWIFAFLGDRFTYLEMNTGDNYHIVQPMTIMDYFRYIYQENPQLFIFPLCDTKFNSGKSNIAWLEATYVGAAFAGNTSLPEFQREGVMDVADLAQIVRSDMDVLERCNRMSWQYICDTLLLSEVNKVRTDRILANL